LRLKLGLREWLEVWIRAARHRFGERPLPVLADDVASARIELPAVESVSTHGTEIGPTAAANADADPIAGSEPAERSVRVRDF
jgi:hypothetical protein